MTDAPDLGRYDDAIAWLRASAAPDPDVRAVWVGGSAATGGYDEWSDLDVDVLCTPGTSPRVHEYLLAGLPLPAASVWRLPDATWPDGRQSFVTLDPDPGPLAAPTRILDLHVHDDTPAARGVDARRHGRVIPVHDPDGADRAARRRRGRPGPPPAGRARPDPAASRRRGLARAPRDRPPAAGRGHRPLPAPGLLPAGDAAAQRRLPVALRLRPALPARRPARRPRRPGRGAAARAAAPSPSWRPLLRLDGRAARRAARAESGVRGLLRVQRGSTPSSPVSAP